MKWDKSNANSEANRERRASSFEESHHFMSVHDMFRLVVRKYSYEADDSVP